jgi:hypothetical protein
LNKVETAILKWTIPAESPEDQVRGVGDDAPPHVALPTPTELEMCSQQTSIDPPIASTFSLPRATRMRSQWQFLSSLAVFSFLAQFWVVLADVDAVAAIEKASNDSLLWGPYRPNLYFGIRPRIPKSLMTGLLWTRVEDYQSIQNSMLTQVSLIRIFAHCRLSRFQAHLRTARARWVRLG